MKMNLTANPSRLQDQSMYNYQYLNWFEYIVAYTWQIRHFSGKDVHEEVHLPQRKLLLSKFVEYHHSRQSCCYSTNRRWIWFNIFQLVHSQHAYGQHLVITKAFIRILEGQDTEYFRTKTKLLNDVMTNLFLDDAHPINEDEHLIKILSIYVTYRIRFLLKGTGIGQQVLAYKHRIFRTNL